MPYDAGVPVICVGNMTAGGAGKTPTVLALARRLKKRGKKPAILSRGYKRAVADLIKVDPAEHTPEQVGDEPLLIARQFPCYVSANRAEAARQAVTDGADILLMDDGLQHHSLKKDKQLLVIDGGYGFGNEMLLPAGPLRDKPGNILPQVDAVLIIRSPQADVEKYLSRHLMLPRPSPLPEGEGIKKISSPSEREQDGVAGEGKEMTCYHASMQPLSLPDKQQNYVAFAGLGRPEKFFDMLVEHGLTLAKAIRYPDHHAYAESDRERLIREAEEANATLITTRKDAVKLPEDFREQVAVVDIELVIENEEQFIDRLLDST